jgi:hypothetical protein
MADFGSVLGMLVPMMGPDATAFVNNFNERQISIDGRNEQTLDAAGASVRLKWDWGSVVLNSITGYEKVKAYSRGDIDGGFGAVFAPPMGPGFIPFPSESADGLPKHKQITQEFRLESRNRGSLDWLVGAYWDDREPMDQTDTFVKEGIWQNGYLDKFNDLVGEMKVGDRIAIKAASTQRDGLPFDGRGKTVHQAATSEWTRVLLRENAE